MARRPRASGPEADARGMQSLVDGNQIFKDWQEPAEATRT
jgi:hypothetical protein